jgi:DNA-binding CsgD family transcriptional regulator/PAS domain-containing protein
MTDVDLVSHLIGDIYDAALDSALWTDVLEQVCRFVGGSAASLYSKDVVVRQGAARYNWNMPAEALTAYFDDHVRFDPVTVSQFFFEVGDIYSVADLMPYDEFVATPVYQRWAKPNGWVDHLAATLDKSASGFALFGVFRNESQGLVDDAMRDRMRLLVPHMRRAVLIGNVIDVHKARSSALSDAFDAIDSSVFLVDRFGRIVFVNEAGQALLGSGAVLSRPQNVLTAVEPHAARTLRDVLVTASEGDSAIGAAGIAVPLSKQPDHNWFAHVLPLTSGARLREGRIHSAVAAVFVRKASAYASPPLEIVTKLYKLSPGEVRVLQAMLSVTGVSKIAAGLGLAESTVKTHLQHLFAKTGVRRQTDLVKLVAAHADPLRS